MPDVPRKVRINIDSDQFYRKAKRKSRNIAKSDFELHTINLIIKWMIDDHYIFSILWAKKLPVASARRESI